MKLHGAERGHCRPEWPVTVRIMDEDTGAISEESCKFVLVPPKWQQRFSAWAWRYLAQPHLFAGGPIPDEDKAAEENILMLAYALRTKDGAQRFPFPQTLFDEGSKKFDPAQLNNLDIRDQMPPTEQFRLLREYNAFRDAEVPPQPSKEQWEALLNEGKSESLRTLLLRHGSSAILPVLRGLESLWRASQDGSGTDGRP